MGQAVWAAQLAELRRDHPNQGDDDEDDHNADRHNVDAAGCQENARIHAGVPFLLLADAGELIRAMAARMSVSDCTLRSL